MIAVAPRRRRGRLAMRVYGFAVTTVAVVIGLMILMAAVLQNPHVRPYGYMLAALAEQLAGRHPTRAALVAAVPAATRDMPGRLALYDGDGQVLWRRGDLTAAPTAGERRAAAAGAVAFDDDDRVVVGVPGHPGLMLAYDPDARPPPGVMLAVLGLVLVVIAAPALWFARGIARPLRRLEATAEAFGAGDIAARSRLTDRGELGAVGRAFDTMAASVERMLRAQRELLADISHELHTPLARIRVALELATEDPDAARDVLAEVGVDLAEIEQIVDDLLTVVRLDLPGGAGALPRRPILIADLMRRSGERFASLHPRRALALSPPGEPVLVQGDGILLRRALDNLLDNAAKYSPDDAPIAVAARADGGRVVVDVVDRGIGMTADELASAFTPFWRADHSRARGTGGVGLGLALARRVARAHGGDVLLRSSRGEGTTASLSVLVEPP